MMYFIISEAFSLSFLSIFLLPWLERVHISSVGLPRLIASCTICRRSYTGFPFPSTSISSFHPWSGGDSQGRCPCTCGSSAQSLVVAALFALPPTVIWMSLLSIQTQCNSMLSQLMAMWHGMGSLGRCAASLGFSPCHSMGSLRLLFPTWPGLGAPLSKDLEGVHINSDWLIEFWLIDWLIWVSNFLWWLSFVCMLRWVSGCNAFGPVSLDCCSLVKLFSETLYNPAFWPTWGTTLW